MVALILYAMLIMAGLLAAFFIGKHDAAKHLIHENTTLKGVQRAQNALILDQKHQIMTVDGLWATDLVRLIKHHKERELFFRIGYPEDRL